MSETKGKGGFSAFTINTIFVVLMIMGIALIPLLSLQLSPSRSLPSVTIYYGWQGMPSRIIEQEVTNPVEAVLATLTGVEKITSTSSTGSANIRLEFDKEVDLNFKQFEISSLLRQTWDKMPVDVRYPLVYMNRPDEDANTSLLQFEVNGNASPAYILKLVEEQIKPRIGAIPGVYEVSITGANEMQWELVVDQDLMDRLEISYNEIYSAYNRFLAHQELGSTSLNVGNSSNKIYLSMQGHQGDSIRWENIPVAEREGRIIMLTELATIQLVEQEPRSFHRINGLNTLMVLVSAEKNVNNITLADEVKAELESIREDLPPGYSLRLQYDSTEYLKEELSKVMYRTLLSVLLLLVFVFLISREFRYMLIITISLIANLAIAFIFYYLLKLEIHLYSLAGITVSFGIIIDNTIIMTDHMRHLGHKKVFLAILAATLTTVGALTVIFFLSEEQRITLVDFAAVVIVNLMVSLAVALFFIPSLLEKIPLGTKKKNRWIRRKRPIVWFSLRYRKAVLWAVRYRWVLLLVSLLGFGLPIYMLPDKIEHRDRDLTQWEERYNKILGNDNYVRKIKPVIDKSLGGSLRLFTEKVMGTRRFYYRGDEQPRTVLRVSITQPPGLTIHDLNNIALRTENLIAEYEEVEMFTTNISNGERASIQIWFDPEHEYGFIPFLLKARLESYAMTIGNCSYGIYGVGRGFSNYVGGDNISGNYNIVFRGYEYDQLMGYAEQFKDSLLIHPRIQEVYILGGSTATWGTKKEYHNRMSIDALQLAEYHTNVNEAYSRMQRYSKKQASLPRAYINGTFVNASLRSNQSQEYDLWAMNNYLMPLASGSRVKFGHFSEVKREIGNDNVVREDQEYVIMVKYDFIGTGELGNIILERKMESIKRILPLGFSAERQGYRYSWGEDDDNYQLLFLVIAIIFIICSVLLESFRQPLAVISLIPFSFIGVFLTFHLFKLPFDEGGFAAFLLLSGLVVNSALYIINDYNNLIKRFPNKPGIRLYVKAYHTKIVPILLTILSTVVGLLPFLLAGKDERFWFPLAAGTIGGLVFSVLGLLFLLPVINRHLIRVNMDPATFKKRKKKSHG